MTVDGADPRQIERFDGTNFHLWKYKLSMLLKEKNLWNIVTGVESSPLSDSLKANFLVKQQKAASIITLCLSNAIIPDIIGEDDPKLIWDKLTSLYESKTLVNTLFLRRKLFTIVKSTTHTMREHINEVRSLADQLKLCGSPVDEKDIVMTLLMSLPEQHYSGVITALSTKKPSELSLDYIKSFLHEHDQRHTLTDNNAETAFISTSIPSRKCFFCKRPGHIKKDCHKFASWMKKKNADGNIQASVATSRNRSDDLLWYLDSGASRHMTSNITFLKNYEVKPRAVNGFTSETTLSPGQGTVDFGTFRLSQVMLVPNLHINLISTSKLDEANCKIEHSDGKVTITDHTGKIIVKGRRTEDGLYMLDLHCKTEKAMVATNDDTLWHRRLGHMSQDRMKSLSKCVNGLSLVGNADKNCETCITGKQIRVSPSKESSNRSTEILGLLHTDVWGPFKHTSLGKSRYFIQFIDDASRYTWVMFFEKKSEVDDIIRKFQDRIEKEIDMKIKVIRSDNGGEYVSKSIKRFFESKGIRHQTTAPRTPEQNGVAERSNRTIIEIARCMLIESKLSKEFWAEAVATAVYLKNRAGTVSLNGKTPYEALYGSKPDIGHLKVFGCNAFVLDPNRPTKLDAKSYKVKFIGYFEDSKAYRFYDTEQKKLIKSRDAVFLETSFDNTNIVEEDVIEFQTSSETTSIECIPKRLPVNEPVYQENPNPIPKRVKGWANTENEPQKISQEEEFMEIVGRAEATIRGVAEEIDQSRPRRSTRIQAKGNATCLVMRTNDEPDSWKEMLERKDANKWLEAAKTEYQSIVENETFELVELPKGRKAISGKWVFKVKRKSDGTILKYKARWVAKGYKQVKGVDFEETFAPVAKFMTIRCLLALAATLNMHIHQMDFVTAFLNGELKEEVYIDPPEGFTEESHPEKVWKLKKTLYGLKQSPRCWYLKLHIFLEQAGFIRSNLDHSLYIHPADKVILVVYVDDLLIFSECAEQIESVKEKMNSKFKMTDLGELEWFLGMRILRDRSKKLLWIDQEQYAEKLLEKFGMMDSRPVATPLDPSIRLSNDMCPTTEEERQEMDSVPYSSVVGSLMYLMLGTRPDMATTVGTLSRYVSNPGQEHWKAAKRVLRYLRGTTNLSLKFDGNTDNALTLSVWSDADWGGNHDSRKSTTGYLCLLSGAAISWSSKQQPTVALSTAEAEYMALSATTQETIWLRRLLSDIGINTSSPTIIYSDNQGAIALASNPIAHARTKHIDIRHHFVREQVLEETIKVVYCPTNDMVADLLTKGLPSEKHSKFVTEMGMGKSGQVE